MLAAAHSACLALPSLWALSLVIDALGLWQRSAVTGIEDEFEQSSLYLHSLFSLQVGVSRLAVNPANRR